MNSKRVFFISSTVVVCALLLFESGSAAFQKRRSRIATARPKVEDLYRTNCARCHGADGRGDTPLGTMYKAPDLTSRDWWQENPKLTSTRSMVSIVTHGKAGMPAFGKKLKRSEIDLLAGYMRRFKEKSTPAPTKK